MKELFAKNSLSYFSLIIIEFLGKILYFPIWWYSVGLLKKIKSSYLALKDKEKSLGLSVWIKNILVPMYGQYDIGGRIISFFIRLFQIIFRSIVMIIYLFIYLLAICLWIAFPVFLVLALIFQIF